MGVRIIHFGLDKCHRIAILKSAGYVVEGCNSASQLRATIAEASSFAAVAMTECDGALPTEALSLVRANSDAPLILFQSRNPHYNESHFDWVVRVLTDPRQWLSDIETVIERNRSARRRAYSFALSRNMELEISYPAGRTG